MTTEEWCQWAQSTCSLKLLLVLRLRNGTTLFTVISAHSGSKHVATMAKFRTRKGQNSAWGLGSNGRLHYHPNSSLSRIHLRYQREGWGGFNSFMQRAQSQRGICAGQNRSTPSFSAGTKASSCGSWLAIMASWRYTASYWPILSACISDGSFFPCWKSLLQVMKRCQAWAFSREKQVQQYAFSSSGEVAEICLKACWRGSISFAIQG